MLNSNLQGETPEPDLMDWVVQTVRSLESGEAPPVPPFATFEDEESAYEEYASHPLALLPSALIALAIKVGASQFRLEISHGEGALFMEGLPAGVLRMSSELAANLIRHYSDCVSDGSVWGEVWGSAHKEWSYVVFYGGVSYDVKTVFERISDGARLQVLLQQCEPKQKD